MVSVRRHAGHWRAYLAGGGLALILATEISLAGLQRPSPDPRRDITTHEPQDGSATAKVIAWNCLAVERQRKSIKEGNEEDGKDAADWWLVILTGGLIAVGLLQAYVFWIQAGRLRQTIDKMDEIDKRQATDVGKSIKAAEDAATASGKLAIATAAHVRIAEQSLVNSFRPFFMLRPYFTAGSRYNLSNHFAEPYFHFQYQNKGTSLGIIKEIGEVIHIYDQSPSAAISDHVMSLFCYDTIELEELTRLRITPFVGEWNPGIRQRVSDGTLFAFAFGKIVYEGLAGHRHETRFCWAYSTKTGSFEEHGGQEYNRRI